MHEIKLILGFLIALMLGSILAALVSFALSSPESFSIWPVVGVAATYVIFGLGPAVAFGLPALWLLRRLHVTRLAAALAMTAGGGAVGTLVTFGMFHRFEPLGAIAGASIGLLQGVLLYRPSSVRVVSRSP
jgi:hypothetical protein